MPHRDLVTIETQTDGVVITAGPRPGLLKPAHATLLAFVVVLAGLGIIWSALEHGDSWVDFAFRPTFLSLIAGIIILVMWLMMWIEVSVHPKTRRATLRCIGKNGLTVLDFPPYYSQDVWLAVASKLSHRFDPPLELKLVDVLRRLDG